MSVTNTELKGHTSNPILMIPGFQIVANPLSDTIAPFRKLPNEEDFQDERQLAGVIKYGFD